MTSSALVTYITIFGGSTLALAVILTLMQHLRVAPKKQEPLL